MANKIYLHFHSLLVNTANGNLDADELFKSDRSICHHRTIMFVRFITAASLLFYTALSASIPHHDPTLTPTSTDHVHDHTLNTLLKEFLHKLREHPAHGSAHITPTFDASRLLRITDHEGRVMEVELIGNLTATSFTIKDRGTDKIINLDSTGGLELASKELPTFLDKDHAPKIEIEPVSPNAALKADVAQAEQTLKDLKKNGGAAPELIAQLDTQLRTIEAHAGDAKLSTAPPASPEERKTQAIKVLVDKGMAEDKAKEVIAANQQLADILTSPCAHKQDGQVVIIQEGKCNCHRHHSPPPRVKSFNTNFVAGEGD